MFMILYVVFTKVFPLGKGIPHYPVICLWESFLELFTEITSQGLGKHCWSRGFNRKISIPRWLIIFSTSIECRYKPGAKPNVLVVFMG